MTNPLVGHVLGSHSHVLLSHMLVQGLVSYVMSHVLGHVVGHRWLFPAAFYVQSHAPKRVIPSSLVSLSDSCQNFVLRQNKTISE